MKENRGYIDNLNERRLFFHKNFPLKISRRRRDVNIFDILKNSCPVCGYLTLIERNIYDICGICFWEDDGIDDFEENNESGPNRMTLKEGRILFHEAKQKLLTSISSSDNFRSKLKNNFVKLDNLIKSYNVDKNEILKLQDEIVNILSKNKVYGLDKLFD